MYHKNRNNRRAIMRRKSERKLKILTNVYHFSNKAMSYSLKNNSKLSLSKAPMQEVIGKYPVKTKRYCGGKVKNNSLSSWKHSDAKKLVTIYDKISDFDRMDIIETDNMK